MSEILAKFCLLNFYYSFVMPYLTAGIELWGKAADYLVYPISVIKTMYSFNCRCISLCTLYSGS
jgi:hypothetical protein